jgi:hypothetical protein
MGASQFPIFNSFDLDAEEDALRAYFLRLELLSPKIQGELADALHTWRERWAVEEVVQAEFNAIVKTGMERMQVHGTGPGGVPIVGPTLTYTPAAAAGEVRTEALELRAESAAGALVLMVDDCIRRLRDSIRDPQSGRPPRPDDFRLGHLGGDAYASTLVYAAGNAYRHARDWEGLIDGSGNVDARHRKYKDAERTLAILRSAMNLARVADQTPCVAAVERLTASQEGADPFVVLWSHLESVGRDYARAHAGGDATVHKVAEALAAQREYARIPVSLSGDERLRDLG